MAVLGVQMMMVKDQVAEQGMWPVLQRLAELDLQAVEVSQIPMTEGPRGGGTPAGPPTTGDNLEEHFDKIVADARRLGTRFARIGMMPFTAMVSQEACEAWAAECEPAAQRLAGQGITLCYHNHHVDLAKFGDERIFDIVRRVAPSMNFEVDLHWVQRGGMAPLDMLEEYAGVCKLIHVKDFRVVPVAQEVVDLLSAGKFAEGFQGFLNIAQFAEVGQGNMNWPKLLPAAEAAGAEFFFIEQDETYGRDPFDCIADSRAYLATIGY